MSFYVKLEYEWVVINGIICGREQSCPYIYIYIYIYIYVYCIGVFLRDWESQQRPQLTLS